MRWMVGLLVLGCGLGLWLLGAEDPVRRTRRASAPVEHITEPPRHPAYPEPIDLAVVDRERDLHGIIVRAADGKPVPGADVRVRFFPRRSVPLPLADDVGPSFEGPATISAVDGSFSLTLEQDAVVTLFVRAAGFAPVTMAMRRAGGRVRVELGAPVILTVHVVGASGEVVAGADVQLVRHTVREAPHIDRRGTTDAAGNWRLTDLPPGIVAQLHVEHARHGAFAERKLELPASGASVFEARFKPGKRVFGRVIEEVTGNPIPGARVGRTEAWRKLHARTDNNGRYDLIWNLPDHQIVLVTAQGYGAEASTIGASGEVNFKLRRGFTVRGVVVGADGRSIAGEQVTAVGRGRSTRRSVTGPIGLSTSCVGRTGADGAFEIADLRAATPHTVIIVAAGYGRTLLEFHPPKRGQPPEVDLGQIELPLALSIRGRVVQGGQPVGEQRLGLSGANADRGRLLGSGRASAIVAGMYAYARTDDLGRFEVGGLAPGTYHLRVPRPGAPRFVKRIVVGAVDVEVLVELPPGRPFVVTVADENGKPVPGAYAWVTMENETAFAQFDAQGRALFQLPEPPSSVSVRTAAEGYLTVSRDLDGDETEVHLVMARGVPIRGTVVTAKGTRIERPVVRASRGGKKIAEVTGNANGEFTLYVAPGGPCRIDFLGEGSVSGGRTSGRWQGSVGGAVPGGAPVNLVVTAPKRRKSTVTIRVLRPDGTPIRGAMVSLFGRTNAKGEVTTHGLPSHPCPLVVKWEGGDLAAPKVSSFVPNGQTVEVRFRIADPITGRLMRDGRPAQGVTVTAYRAGERNATAVTNTAGEFRLLVAADDRTPYKLQFRTRAAELGFLDDVPPGADKPDVKWSELSAN